MRTSLQAGQTFHSGAPPRWAFQRGGTGSLSQIHLDTLPHISDEGAERNNVKCKSTEAHRIRPGLRQMSVQMVIFVPLKANRNAERGARRSNTHVKDGGGKNNTITALPRQRPTCYKSTK